MYRWPPNVIRTHLETGPRILLSPGAVPAPFYITQNIVPCGTCTRRAGGPLKFPLAASRQHGHPSQWQKRAVSYSVQPVVYRLLYPPRQRSPESASRSSGGSRSRLSDERTRLGAAASVGRLGEVVSHASHAVVPRPDVHGKPA